MELYHIALCLMDIDEPTADSTGYVRLNEYTLTVITATVCLPHQ